MNAGASRCPKCGQGLEAAVRNFRFGERIVSVLVGEHCRQCGKQPSPSIHQLRSAPLPELTLAGYALPRKRAARVKRPTVPSFWTRAAAVLSLLLRGKLSIRVRIVRSHWPNYNIVSAPLHPRLRA